MKSPNASEKRGFVRQREVHHSGDLQLLRIGMRMIFWKRLYSRLSMMKKRGASLFSGDEEEPGMKTPNENGCKN